MRQRRHLIRRAVKDCVDVHLIYTGIRLINALDGLYKVVQGPTISNVRQSDFLRMYSPIVPAIFQHFDFFVSFFNVCKSLVSSRRRALSVGARRFFSALSTSYG